MSDKTEQCWLCGAIGDLKLDVWIKSDGTAVPSRHCSCRDEIACEERSHKNTVRAHLFGRGTMR